MQLLLRYSNSLQAGRFVARTTVKARFCVPDRTYCKMGTGFVRRGQCDLALAFFHPFSSSIVFMAFCTVNLTLRISKLRILYTLLLYDMIKKNLLFVRLQTLFPS